MCDVGQGDASVIRVSAHSGVVVDAGPDPRALRRCLNRLGVRHIDALILTHFHADHVEGVMALSDVERILVSPQREPLIEYERVHAHFGTDFDVIQRGDRVTIGDLTLDVVWPDARNLSGDPNTDSVMMLLHGPNGTVLLGADTDVAAQRHFRPPRAAVMKVPHHGSRYQDPTFLTAVGAGVALVSVGAGNDYGHPAADTVSVLRSGGSRVLRTDEVGSIALVTRNGRLSVVSERR
jgi:competence protein ComEC